MRRLRRAVPITGGEAVFRMLFAARGTPVTHRMLRYGLDLIGGRQDYGHAIATARGVAMEHGMELLHVDRHGYRLLRSEDGNSVW